MEVSMIFSLCKKRLFLLFLGSFLALQPSLYAHNPGETPATSQRSWSSALGTAVNAALYFGPATYSAYEQSKNLYASQQKKLIGNQALNPQTKLAIQKIMIEMNIEDTPEILAMRNQAEFEEVPDSDKYTIVDSVKKNYLGIHATNAYIFIDEDIINFEEHPLRSTFLVKRELARYKNNHFSKVIIGNVALTMAQAVAFYKTFPLVTQGCNNSIHKLGWTSFNDPQQHGIFLGVSRFTLNYLVCPFVTQLIIEKIRNSVHAWYHQHITPPLDGTFVPRGHTLTLFAELIKLIPDYNNTETNNCPGKELLDTTLREMALIALNRYHSSQIIDNLNRRFSRDEDFKPHIERLISFIEQNDKHG